MTRLRADIYLLIVAIIWGFAFVAQKTGMAGIGPFTFVAVRFLLSALFVLPFVWHEFRQAPPLTRQALVMMLPTVLCCAIGVCLQQVGLQNTSVTNAGFITSLYVVFTPFVAGLVFRTEISKAVWPSCVFSLAGLWYLNGGSFSALTSGDFLVLLCSLCYAGHVASTGWYLAHHDRPVFFSLIQYLATMMLGLILMFSTEKPTVTAIFDNWMPLAFAGIVSGGIAYTLQAVAQRKTPAADAAIILSSESLFAALAGVMLLGEDFTRSKALGCGLILVALVFVQVSLVQKERQLKA